MPALPSLPSLPIVMVGLISRGRRPLLTKKYRCFRILVPNEHVLLVTSGWDVFTGLKRDAVEAPVPILWVSVTPACGRPSRTSYKFPVYCGESPLSFWRDPVVILEGSRCHLKGSRCRLRRSRCQLKGSRYHLKGMVAVINSCRVIVPLCAGGLVKQ